MAEQSIANSGTQREESAAKFGRRIHAGHVLAAERHEEFVLCESGLIRVPSSLREGQFYSVDVMRGSCTCPDHVFGGFRCKHITAACALVAVREHVATFPASSAQIARIRVGNVLRLFAKVSEPIEGASAASSYDLICAITGYRFSPWSLQETARDRHQRVLERVSV